MARDHPVALEARQAVVVGAACAPLPTPNLSGRALFMGHSSLRRRPGARRAAAAKPRARGRPNARPKRPGRVCIEMLRTCGGDRARASAAPRGAGTAYGRRDHAWTASRACAPRAPRRADAPARPLAEAREGCTGGTAMVDAVPWTRGDWRTCPSLQRRAGRGVDLAALDEDRARAARPRGTGCSSSAWLPATPRGPSDDAGAGGATLFGRATDELDAARARRRTRARSGGPAGAVGAHAGRTASVLELLQVG